MTAPKCLNFYGLMFSVSEAHWIKCLKYQQMTKFHLFRFIDKIMISKYRLTFLWHFVELYMYYKLYQLTTFKEIFLVKMKKSKHNFSSLWQVLEQNCTKGIKTAEYTRAIQSRQRSLTNLIITTDGVKMCPPKCNWYSAIYQSTLPGYCYHIHTLLANPIALFSGFYDLSALLV